MLRHAKNQGKGAALRTGFREATGDFVAVQDADLEYDPMELRGLLEPLRTDKADVVLGSRFLGGRPHRVLYFWHCRREISPRAAGPRPDADDRDSRGGRGGALERDWCPGARSSRVCCSVGRGQDLFRHEIMMPVRPGDGSAGPGRGAERAWAGRPRDTRREGAWESQNG